MKKAITSSELPISPDGTLYHIGLKSADNIPKNIFLVGDPKRAYAVAKYFDKGPEFKRKNREFITLAGTYKGIPVAVKEIPIGVIGVGIGTDNTEEVAVELHAVNEYDHQADIWKEQWTPLNIIRIGTSGSPQKNIPVGSLAISQYAIGLDNTGRFYPFTSLDPVIKKIQKRLNKTDIKKIHPYVSGATPKVVNALIAGAKNIGLEQNKGRGFYTGITSSAPGFYGPQGRKIGRLSNILIPDLQEILEKIDVNGLKVVNNEMESSIMFRLFGELLNYNVGTICAVLANRNKGEVVSPEEYTNSVDRCIRAGLEAMKILNQ